MTQKPDTPPRRCGTCKWWNIEVYPSRNPIWADCLFPLPTLPFWVDASDRTPPREDEGTDCPAWTPKEKTQ